VGRLDWDSEGMLLLTNDGDFANKVMHPKAEVTKTYLVKLDGQPQPHHIEKLKKGVTIVGGRVSARHIEKIKKAGENKSDKYEWYKIVITEGKNRQIRQMFAKVGFDVLKLQRVAIGRLRLGALKTGDLVYLNDVAIERVFQPDDPVEVKTKRTYKGRATSAKKTAKPVSKLKVNKKRA
jgi:23S rRNA pseudouridine2605 synthase